MFGFREEDYLTLFAVLVRLSTVVMVVPFFGDQVVPATTKILLSLALTVVVYPILVTQGQVNPKEALVWGASLGGLVRTVGLEAVFGLIIGYASRLVFDVIQAGGDVVGNFMGFASASQFDPHQESQTQVISRFYSTLAMLLFLALDAHHVMLRAILQSYQYVAMGNVHLGAALGETLLNMTADVLKIALQLAGPMAMTFFCINIIYGIVAKAMPQINILVLSFSISAIVGMCVIWITIPEFSHLTRQMFDGMGNQLGTVMKAMGQ